MDERVNVFFMPYDCDFRGVTMCQFDDGENFFTIVINSNLSEEAQLRVFRHEIAHIANRDFEKDIPIGELEAMRHASV